MTTRRTFLRGLGLAGGAALLGPDFAHASQPPLSGGPPSGWKILQIFLFTAPSHVDTFWGPETFDGAETASDGPEAAQVFAGPGDLSGLDHTVHLGYGMAPLVELAGLHKLRLVAMQSTSLAHRVASAYSLTGINPGNPAALSLGARVQFTAGPTAFPASWVVDSQRERSLTELATARANLPFWSRPFVVPVSRSFIDRLERDDKSRVDDLLGMYRERYAAKLDHPSTGRVRAEKHDTYEDAARRMRDWDQIHSVLSGVDIGDASLGGGQRGLVLADHLLKNGAQHVTVICGNNAGMGFDTHDMGGDYSLVAHARRQNDTLLNATRLLRDLAAQPDSVLSQTLIVLHAEFGRYHDHQDGSEHWARGYASVLAGGPVQSGNLVGRLSFQDDRTYAEDPFSPAELLDGLANLAGADVSSSAASLAHRLAGISI